MRTQYEIAVTADDVREGMRNHSTKCMVAVALQRAIPSAIKITVDMQTIRFSLPLEKRRLVYLTPGNVMRYIIAFDAGDKIEPFTFTLKGKPAYDIAMRPRVQEGPRPEDPNMVRTIAAPHGALIVQHVSKNQLPPMPRGNATARYYGVRDMRVNQQNDAAPAPADQGASPTEPPA